ncbi:MAG: hypothetical protein ABJB40_05450 [Acidobacteriota bacterium]
MNYVIAVADLFLARCPSVTILSPADFLIIAEWEKQEIPVGVVLGSINNICDELGDQVSEVASISDIRSAVKRHYVDWLRINAAMEQAAA